MYETIVYKKKEEDAYIDTIYTIKPSIDRYGVLFSKKKKRRSI